MTSPFTITRDGAVAILTQDDGKANTYLQATFEDLISKFDEIEKSDATAVLLRGRVGVFSAGLNLKVLPTLGPAEWIPLLEKFGEAVMRVFLFPRPIVAEVTGHAIGAGAIFAFASDVRIFTKGPFKFGLNEVPNGMPVPGFGVEPARFAIRLSDQMELICHGRMLSPEEAVEYRIGVSASDPDDAPKLALQKAHALSELPSSVYAATKLNVRGAAGEHVRTTLAAEVRNFVAAVAGKK